MTEDQIKHMVNRFLCWKLPENFNPDAGISFKAAFNEHTAYPMKHEPSGTNLLNWNQADAMVRHMMEGLPSPPPVGAMREQLARAICCGEHGQCILGDCEPTDGELTACIALKGYHDKTIDAVMSVLRAMPLQDHATQRHTVVGRVTGKLYDGDQVPGMPSAICHACGLTDYPCGNPDCPKAAMVAEQETKS